MLSTSQLRRAWAPACRFDGVTVTLNGGARVHIDRRVLPAVLALNEILKRWGYVCERDQTGAFVCRRITGGTNYSLHAYGIALDLNWRRNPYGRILITDMPRGMVLEILALRTRNGKQVWGWGGLYRSIKDAMHYEVVCSPDDLATGVTLLPVAPPTTSTGERYFVTPEDEAKFEAIVARHHQKTDQKVESEANKVISFLVTFITDTMGKQFNRMAEWTAAIRSITPEQAKVLQSQSAEQLRILRKLGK